MLELTTETAPVGNARLYVKKKKKKLQQKLTNYVLKAAIRVIISVFYTK